MGRLGNACSARSLTFDQVLKLVGPIQATGAVILRLAIVLAARKGVRIIAPVHDAIMIEARDEDIEEHCVWRRKLWMKHAGWC